MHDSWADILVRSFREVALRLASYAPRVLAVLTLVLAGWIVAAVLRTLALRILRGADFDGRAGRLRCRRPAWQSAAARLSGPAAGS